MPPPPTHLGKSQCLKNLDHQIERNQSQNQFLDNACALRFGDQTLHPNAIVHSVLIHQSMP
ncbi:Uncharacterised protein [Vibrio cholerae]|uniref:Uncharacterized protein n=1 Tax=Vibrio cholerae TaxID=666 RepID=A0A656AQF4_VIBCL|nr:Uncharacterised protein [Vibrio cholerae]CSB16710.1 Uncharacterised protein [Vibrio cholerae]CSB25384.1 Uncharacterised protein [Vibrio cholerae]CSB55888.1 Uncharacterised protein [Vibrio cholerae]CSB78629.1 Uncharacterised protein [Vibrio cholerae]